MMLEKQNGGFGLILTPFRLGSLGGRRESEIRVLIYSTMENILLGYSILSLLVGNSDFTVT
jgi:hypothetical protein